MLVAAPAAAPAQATDTGVGMSPTTVDTLSAGYGNNAGGGAITPPPNPVDNSQSTPTAQDNTATNSQATRTTGGNGGSATGGNAGPSRAAGDGSGSHGGSAYANGGNAESHSSFENEQSNQVGGGHSSGPGYGGGGDRWGGGRGGHDGFVLETTKPRHPARAATGRNQAARFPPPVSLSAAGPGTRLEANQRRGHESAQASPRGGVLPGRDGPLPGQNPFFSLLSGPGGAGAGLTMLLLLAVLASSLAFRHESFKALRTRAAVWRPLAYVPPIELPG